MKDRLPTMRPRLLAVVAIVAAVTGLAASAQAAPAHVARALFRSMSVLERQTQTGYHFLVETNGRCC